VIFYTEIASALIIAGICNLLVLAIAVVIVAFWIF
jgi:hypothetical protein